MLEELKFKHWRAERDAHAIVWLALDKADGNANVLNREVLEELDAVIDQLRAHPPRGLVIHSGKKNGFIAGADIKEFTTLGSETDGLALVQRAQGILNRLEALRFPTVAMIQGFCLGGGLELAVACRYRVAEEDPRTRLGLPEVKLGIHPGFGGTVRIVQLIGALPGMELMLTGRTVDARAAARMGLIDYAVPLRQLRSAARSVVLNPPQPKHATRLQAATNWPMLRPLVAKQLRKRTAAKARPDHYPAPFALIDLWARYGDDPHAMMNEEAHSVAKLVTGHTAQNLIRVFYLQERLKSLGRKELIAPRHVHVVGGGVMGGDIAAWCALQGFKVTVQDRNHQTLARVLARAHGLYKKKLKLPRLVQAAMDRLIPDHGGIGVAHADVVIEAIFENTQAKQQLFADLERRAKPDALLATNTSSIPLEEIGEALARPERLVGLHFFNPVAQMQLVEIVEGRNTDPDVARKAAAFVRHIDRLPLPVRSSPGFLVNRVLMPYLLEAVTLGGEGVPAPLIDQAALDFGMPMGPIELADTVGLDICLSVGRILADKLQLEIPDRLGELVAAGQLGRKSGRGFYEWQNDRPLKPKIASGYAAPTSLADRLVLRMINESVACLREGVVADADLLDAGMIFGTGFAPFRGGPMHHVRESGRDEVCQRLQDLEAAYGSRFHADPGWSG